MKKLTETEYAALPLIGRGRISAFYREVARLAIGEILLLEKEDWKKKYNPGRTVTSVAKRTGRTYEVMTVVTGEGWTVKRLK